MYSRIVLVFIVNVYIPADEQFSDTRYYRYLRGC
jgi:hypothetical protein